MTLDQRALFLSWISPITTAAVLLAACFGSAAEVRTWKGASGRFVVEAELLRVDGQTAILRRTDGRIVRVHLRRLSQADRAYLQQHAEGPAHDVAYAVMLGDANPIAGCIGQELVTVAGTWGKPDRTDVFTEAEPPAVEVASFEVPLGDTSYRLDLAFDLDRGGRILSVQPDRRSGRIQPHHLVALLDEFGADWHHDQDAKLVFPDLDLANTYTQTGIVWRDDGVGVKFGREVVISARTVAVGLTKIVLVTANRCAYATWDSFAQSGSVTLQALTICDANTFWKRTFERLMVNVREGFPADNSAHYARDRSYEVNLGRRYGEEEKLLSLRRLEVAVVAALRNPCVQPSLVSVPLRFLAEQQDTQVRSVLAAGRKARHPSTALAGLLDTRFRFATKVLDQLDVEDRSHIRQWQEEARTAVQEAKALSAAMAKIPRLESAIEGLQTRSSVRQRLALKQFMALGPDAKAALPVLRRFADAEAGGRLERLARQAMRAVDGRQ